MMDVGWGEMLLLAVIALVIFGPDKLPRAAADAGRFVRRLREMASSARSDLTDTAGVDIKAITEDLRSVADLHPRKIVGSAMAGLSLTDDNPPARTGALAAGPGARPPISGQMEGPAPSGTAKVAFDPDAT